MALQRAKALQDYDGHWFVIPSDLAEEFYTDLECGGNDDFEYFTEKYSKYMTDGDLNNIQLYADI